MLFRSRSAVTPEEPSHRTVQPRQWDPEPRNILNVYHKIQRAEKGKNSATYATQRSRPCPVSEAFVLREISRSIVRNWGIGPCRLSLSAPSMELGGTTGKRFKENAQN